jgi:hypothetical protein
MSKAALKKELQRLTQEQLVEHILDLYDKNKAVKEFYYFYLNPKNEKQLIEKYKRIIRREFSLKDPMGAGLKFSVAKRVIAEFRSLQPSSEGLADLMLYLPECACEFTANYGDITQPFYDSTCNNFHKALEFIEKQGLLGDFKLRAEQCVEWASPCGYGFAGEMADIYHDFFS